jgi:biopolymer transport protein ExbD
VRKVNHKRELSFGDPAIGGVNIVPVIDLCLVLLVVLLVVSPMLDKPPVDVQLPKAQVKEEKENNISLTVTPDGRYAVNTELVTKEELPKYLRAVLDEQGQDTLVVIRADKDVQYGDLTDLLAILKSKDVGAQKISLGTEQGGGEVK